MMADGAMARIARDQSASCRCWRRKAGERKSGWGAVMQRSSAAATTAVHAELVEALRKASTSSARTVWVLWVLMS